MRITSIDRQKMDCLPERFLTGLQVAAPGR